MSRILLITDYAPPYVGGMETHAHEYARALSIESNHELVSVLLHAPRALDAIARFTENSGITVPVHTLKDSSMFVAKDMLSPLRQFSPDADTILFFNSIHWTRVLPAIRDAFPQTRIVLRSGGNDIVQAPLTGTGETLSDRQSFIVDSLTRSLDALIVNSTYSKNRMVSLGVPPNLMHIVRGGVDITRFDPVGPLEKEKLRAKLNLPNDFIALAVCRLESFKGLAFAFEVLAEARPQNFLYVLVGDGPLFDELVQIAMRLNIEPLVRFCRSTPHVSVHQYFQAADLYCHFPEESERVVEGGSYIHTETMGRSFCEAMASGLPVLSSHVGGVPEIVENGKHGVLIPMHDLAAATTGLRQMIENADMRKRMGEAGRETAATMYAWEVIRARYEEIFSI